MLSLNNSGMTNVVNNLVSLGVQLSLSNQRLATGRRINTASDDPAGIIALTNLESQSRQIDAAIKNGQRINSVIDVADGAMAEMSSLIGTIQTATLAAAGSSVTAEERAAYQAEIDSAVNAIDSLVNTTSFNGSRILDGAIAYNTSGIDNTKLADVRVNYSNAGSSSATIDVVVVAGAEKASMTYADGALVDEVTMTITGENGSEEFTFASGTTMPTIAAAVNAVTDSTGVVIESVVDGGSTTWYFRSESYGSSQSISVNVTAGTYAFAGAVTSDTGVDATVTVGGQSAVVDGLKIVNSGGAGTSVRFTMEETFGTTAAGSTSFSVTGSGAGFSLGARSTDNIYFGLSSLSSANLGNSEIGYLNSLKSGGTNSLATGNYSAAATIASSASSMLATERARMGAVQTYTVNSTLNSLADTQSELAGSISRIQDLDYAEETANNNRLQILMQANIAIISAMQENTASILLLLS